MDKTFTKWTRWKDRAELPDQSYPGVYALAISEADISGEAFSWLATGSLSGRVTMLVY